MAVKDKFNPIIRIALFILIMFLVAKWVPYGGFVRAITDKFDYQSAQRFTAAIEGEPNPEAWEAVSDYFSLLINTLISIPLLSALITTYHVAVKRSTTGHHAKEWMTSTVRRFLKVFLFTWLFWIVFRVMPYESLINGSQSTALYLAIAIINIAITTAAYMLIMRFIKKR
ncbi:hypothetical protein [Pseudescherichia vulneris]|uniref:hypothetical protein n=1 Tax=Pseudescherichia vulneris TaxID=566 RepID=UPI001EDFD949|nr:hypothetical protein [Pseudescherichia vulneris]